MTNPISCAENGAWIEEQERLYNQDPMLLDPSWRVFFETLNRQEGKRAAAPSPPVSAPLSTPDVLLDVKVRELIHAYRTHGHLAANINPMEQHNAPDAQENLPQLLQCASYELDPHSQALVASYGFFEAPRVPFDQLLKRVQTLYCGAIGFEYMGLGDPDIERFMQQQIEAPRAPQVQAFTSFSQEEKTQILHQLNRSELFERFLHRHYTGQKRFSLEGGETLIPMLHELIEEASGLGYTEFVFGMAHRGRLNVLAHVLEKAYEEIFAEFEGQHPQDGQGSGDVKYHKGFIVERTTAHGVGVKVVLSSNPSHLESVYPVIEGGARARCVQLGDTPEARRRVLPIILHGDAALAGQGVVYETLQMSHLQGYETGGTLHMVVNNQIGFTTPPSQARCTRYCTDLAHGFGIPVLHLNAEHPEACLFATHLSLLLRHQFGCDVFLDLYCYRKYGHNETDEPAFTQPHQADWIKKRPSIRELYLKQLHAEGLDQSVTEKSEKACEEALERAFASRKKLSKNPKKAESNTPPPSQPDSCDTRVSQQQLLALAETCCRIPDSFHAHPKVAHLCKTRLLMAKGEQPCDWGMAEMLAMAVILSEGVDVRLSGQDCARGTFSHRHALWVDQKNEQPYYPLAHIKDNQGRFDVYNSLLSEYAVLGFEFGYSAAYPEACVFWEAQFGDFANGAQVIIDQYIAAAQQKWGMTFDLILLLPHGYEGQGPEHSSARLERFLALCGNDNLCVTYPTTPAQLFHLLRRQQKARVARPLVVMTPKGLLRHPDCVSTLQELAEGSFQEVIGEKSPEEIETVVLCTGRFYYDLALARAKQQQQGMALIRIEQLYPLPKDFTSHLNRYTNAKRYVWAQEEPENMGAWSYIYPQLCKTLPGSSWEYVGRPRSASPAVGSYARHELEHQQLMDALFHAKEKGTS